MSYYMNEMNNFGTIPNEIVNKIFLYTSHPTADIIRKYMSDNNGIKYTNLNLIVDEFGLECISTSGYGDWFFITNELRHFDWDLDDYDYNTWNIYMFSWEMEYEDIFPSNYMGPNYIYILGE